MKVWFWAADTGGSALYRMLLPAMALGWRGHQAAAGAFLPEQWRDTADTIVGARVAKPGPSQTWRALADRGCRRVLDLDDDYFHIDPDNPGAAQEWDAAMLRRLSQNMAAADVVTVVSEPLAEVARQHCDRVQVIPNALAAQNLGHVRDYRPDRLRIGWAGTRATVNELHLAARALRRIVDYRDDIEVHLVGIPPEAAVAAGVAHTSRIRTHGWVDPADYLKVVWGFDIWVAPYRGTPFNAAKFPTKALEAGHLGVPLIASDIRPYRDWIDHGRTGLLVARDHEWGRYLRMLVDDPGLRESMGHAARGRAASNILQTMNQRWEQALFPGNALIAARHPDVFNNSPEEPR